MRHTCAGYKGFAVSSTRARLAFAGRAATLGIVLAVSLGAAGCVGLTGTPSGAANGGGSTGGGTSQSSQISPSSTAVAFGNVTVGSSASQLVTLTVAGTHSVTISSATASGTGFTASGGSNVTLAPGQSVTVSVGFEPAAAGSTTGSLKIASNASNSSVQIPLSGDGVAASGNHSVALNWQASTSPVVGYFIFRSSSGGALAQLNATAVATTNYVDKNVVDGDTYVYAVKSVDASNLLSNFSNSVTVTVPSQ